MVKSPLLGQLLKLGKVVVLDCLLLLLTDARHPVRVDGGGGSAAATAQCSSSASEEEVMPFGRKESIRGAKVSRPPLCEIGGEISSGPGLVGPIGGDVGEDLILE